MTSGNSTYSYIAVEGNIGVGKTLLATKMAEDTGAKLILERFSDNPFLNRFYENPAKYALPVELTFLAERHDQLKSDLLAQENGQLKISDYSFFKSLVFAKTNLKIDEYQLYEKIYRIINTPVVKPDLLIYLHSDTDRLQKNIKSRARSFEQAIPDDYLENIRTTYLDFIHRLEEIPVLMLDVNKIDFKNNAGDYQRMADLIHRPYPAGITSISM